VKDDATTAFLRAIRGNFGNFAGFSVTDIRSRIWASAAYAGARHRVTFELAGDGRDEAADAFLNGLEGREFTLRGHLLADIALLSKERLGAPDRLRIGIEALTIEEA
jgi:hypothetical protein